MTAGRRRRPLCFAVLLIPLLIIFAWPFDLVGRGYRSLVCNAINGSIMNSTLTAKVARLLPDPRPGPDWRAIVAVWNQTTRSIEERFPLDLHQLFYLPAAVFSALTLAGKWTWGGKRVVWKLLIGVALFQLRPIPIFVARERAVVGVFQYDGAFDVFLVLFNRSLVAPLGMAYALPVLLWFGLFRRSIASAARTSTLPSHAKRANQSESAGQHPDRELRDRHGHGQRS